MKRNVAILKYACLISYFISGLLLSLGASAGMVTFESTKVIVGNQVAGDDVFINQSGTYKLTLTDFKLAGKFNGLGLGIENDTGNLQGQIFGQGSFSFNAEAGLYHIELGLTGTEGMGLVGITLEKIDLSSLNPSPVPLPAPILLFASAMVSFFGFLHSKRKMVANRSRRQPVSPVANNYIQL